MSDSAGSGRTAEWRTARARDGARLAYRVTTGSGSARCVLVHALAMDGTFWDRVVPLLPEDEVLVYDCRGHGRSDKPDGPYTAELFAHDLSDILDAAGWREAVVCGASMGGCIAQAFAAAYPDRVQGLGLFDTTAWYGPDARATWAERARKAQDGGMAALLDFQKTRWFGDAFRRENTHVVDRVVEVFLANDVRAYGEACWMLGAFDGRNALAGFRMPCEILLGSEDSATPLEMARALQAAIAGAELKVVEGARHFTPLEVPDAVARSISDLMARRS